jgi:hypothetical protein
MAIQHGLFQFTGKMGGVIGYYMKGKYYTRTAPAFVDQTPATRHAAKDFGKASAAARIIRQAIEDEVSLRKDGSFGNRLTSAMLSVIRADWDHKAGRRVVKAGNLQQLTGMRFNKYAEVRPQTAVQRCFDGSLSVTVIDPLKQFGDDIKHVQFRAIALFPDFGLGTCKTICSETVMLTREEAAQPLSLTIPSRNGVTAIVLLEASACKLFENELRPTGFRNLNAVDIIAVVPAKKEGRIRATGYTSEVVYNYVPAPWPFGGIVSSNPG